MGLDHFGLFIHHFWGSADPEKDFGSLIKQRPFSIIFHCGRFFLPFLWDIKVGCVIFMK
jgi:hypothetical protein